MEKIGALSALAALAQETRLDVFRLLVQAGPRGLPAGQIAAKLGISAPTLAFHLKELKGALLVSVTRQGRSLIYAAEYPTMNALLSFLTENCCGRGADAALPICRPHADSPAISPLQRSA